jgi:predicted SprT family Zn-dependent metalloprotease
MTRLSNLTKVIINDSENDSDDDEIIIIKKCKKNEKHKIDKNDQVSSINEIDHLKKIAPNNLDHLKDIAKKLMIQHKLFDWTFVWNTRCKSRGGCTKYDEKIIEVTKEYALKITQEMFVNTVLHEIAHALVGHENGHNHVWKNKAISIGCNGKVCHNVNFVEFKYEIQCLCNTYKYHRKTRVIQKIEKGNVKCRKCKQKYTLLKK